MFTDNNILLQSGFYNKSFVVKEAYISDVVANFGDVVNTFFEIAPNEVPSVSDAVNLAVSYLNEHLPYEYLYKYDLLLNSAGEIRVVNMWLYILEQKTII
jgi:hypothetical protein